MFTTALELILCEIPEKIQSLRPPPPPPGPPPAPPPTNLFFTFLILRAPPIFSSKRKRKFFCSAPRSIARGGGASLPARARRNSPHTPLPPRPRFQWQKFLAG